MASTVSPPACGCQLRNRLPCKDAQKANNVKAQMGHHLARPSVSNVLRGRAQTQAQAPAAHSSNVAALLRDGLPLSRRAPLSCHVGCNRLLVLRTSACNLSA